MEGYCVQVLLPLENRLLALVGGPKQLAAGELRQNYVQLQLVHQFLQLLVDALELAVP